LFEALNLPVAALRIRTLKNQQQVFDVIRKKYVMLSSEEWVRQHVIHFLLTEKDFPKGLMEVEKGINVFNTEKRVDILVRTNTLKPLLLVECKAPEVRLKQAEINQIARYQITLQAEYSLLTNGMKHLVMHNKNGKVVFLQELPGYRQLISSPLKDK
jgi:hypothetical protein